VHGKFRGAWEDYLTSVLSKHRKLDEIEAVSFEMSFYAGAFVFMEVASSCDGDGARDLREEIMEFMVEIRKRAAKLSIVLPTETTKH